MRALTQDTTQDAVDFPPRWAPAPRDLLVGQVVDVLEDGITDERERVIVIRDDLGQAFSVRVVPGLDDALAERSFVLESGVRLGIRYDGSSYRGERYTVIPQTSVRYRGHTPDPR